MENQHTRSVRSNRSNRFQRNRKSNGTDKPWSTAKNVEKSYDLGPCPWDDQQVKVVSGDETCRAVVTELRNHCKEYSVLGFSCTEPGRRKGKTSLLMLSSIHGLCALFPLSVMRGLPIDLKELLEDENILKVGVYASEIALNLTAYKVITSSVFDVRYLQPEKNLVRSTVLEDLSAEHLNVKLKGKSLLVNRFWKHSVPNNESVDCAARAVRAAIELFKTFEQKEKEIQNVANTQKSLQEFIKAKCLPFLNERYQFRNASVVQYLEPRSVLPAQDIQVIKDASKCREVSKIIREHCQENKLLGLTCQYSKKTVTLLQLATSEGLCALIQVNQIKEQPNELQDILNDKDIIKVGVHTSRAVRALRVDYAINVVNSFDLRYLANKCKNVTGKDDLVRLAKNYLNVDIESNDWRLWITDWKSETVSRAAIKRAANFVQVTVELFKFFEKKLVDERLAGDRKKFVDTLCAPHSDDDYPKRKKNKILDWCQLPEQEIIVVTTIEECEAVVERLRKHCNEYYVLGFDCEWSSKGGKVALLQLATHRGLCALIRLCRLRTIPDVLKKLMKDKQILKVGVGAGRDATKLFREYCLEVKGTFNLIPLAKKCKIQAKGLASLSEEVLSVKLEHKEKGRLLGKFHTKWTVDELDADHIKYAADDAHVGIELFKKFHAKLMPSNESVDLTENLDRFITLPIFHKIFSGSS
ncbi:uncharacterized protein LOC119069009 [Bradysia coprophila]|uniref:uncharacterized protein LOC119069009 n=1 Tax=Bradysia coprophila TaxID=38358 RepID=UPI00187DD94A|nr:uncharacterized protein LOC119069009 [Bradysia coprophila]